MKSKWFALKPIALAMRRDGSSLRDVHRSLNIPNSTLSAWFKYVKLTEVQKLSLRKNSLDNLKIARERAVIWHNNQKELRLAEAKRHALNIFSHIDTNNIVILELALAMLYLGEGVKTEQTAIGNSNPLILKFFICGIVKIYQFERNKIKLELHLRADQNPEVEKKYWAEELNFPYSSFSTISIDKRTVGSPTYPSYHGVCVLQCGNVAIQRRLVYLSKLFCEKIAQ